MIRPDDEDRPFISRWNSLFRILLVESSVKLVARTACDFANFYDMGDKEAGGGAFPGNELLARETGLSERTVRTAWATIRGLNCAERVKTASFDPIRGKRTADEYQLVIPNGWKSYPVLGPKRGKFRCMHCDRLLTPQANSTAHTDGSVTFNVQRFIFCPPPRDKGKGKGCFVDWTAFRRREGLDPWSKMDVWKLFRLSRGEDW